MHDTNLLENQPIAWTPTPEVIERSQLMRFMKQVGVETWDELYQFSIRDAERFTKEVLKFLDIKFDPPYGKLLDTSTGIEFPEWFSTQRRGDAEAETRPEGSAPQSEPEATGLPTSAGLNITEMCLWRWLTKEFENQPALIWEGEEGDAITLSYRELHSQVLTCSSMLLKNGIRKGDAVGIHLPMVPETVVALLSINRIGAIAVPVFSGYGVEAIASRMNAVNAKALFSCYRFPRRGKNVDALDIARKAVDKCPTIEKVFICRRKNDEDEIDDDETKFLDWLVAFIHGESFEISMLSAAKTSAEDPLIILYTSGTTGKPKGIAHTHASFPIKAAQDMAFGTDVGKGTRICWYTDIGWMMGPWLIYGALINGATICIYDGAPDYPTPDRMWEFCAKHKVEVLGISPTLVRALAAHEASKTSSPPYEGGVAAASADGVVLSDAPAESDRYNSGGHEERTTPSARKKREHPPLLRKEGSSKTPFERHDLSSLRAFASTGEPWNPAPWWWLFENVGNSKLPIINYSGGTEIAGGILMGNPLLPIKPCSFPAPCPGMDVDILNEKGEPVKPGEVGELVIKQPWIGMARGFWQERERYLETYWSRFKNIWVHGDWAMRDSDGHWFILGRSDDTLKVAGKRVGPAEVESLLVAHPLVTEAAVIGVPDETKGTAMVAFCVLGSADTHVRMSPKDEKKSQLSSDPEVEQSPSADAFFTGGTGDADKSVRAPLEAELKSLVARDMGKPLAPSKILFVSALPKTRNAKIMRRVIRSAYLGEDPGDLSALENPKTVDEIAALKDRS